MFGVWSFARACAPIFLSAILLSVAVAQPEYHNPVIPGDNPDPSIIRVGKDFWATSTSSEWGPQFQLYHSTDLINWDLTGVVFQHRPAWAVGNFWAPEIGEYHGRYFVYYVGRKPNGPLAVAVATADNPAGPYTDHGPLVSQDAGSIDPVAVTDENGERYLVWKEDGNSRKLPTIIWAQPLKDGLTLTGEPRELIRNDAAWEGAVVEGPFIVRHGDWFYLFYSGGGCCGLNCSYGLGVARSRKLLGPWEKYPANPILAGNSAWKCPGHGSIVSDERGRYWLLYHAYSATNSIYTGREALLDQVVFGDDGWASINNGNGPSVSAPSPFGTVQKRGSRFETHFAIGSELGWQWPQDDEPKLELPFSRSNTLNSRTNGNGVVLRSPPASTNDLLGAVFAKPTEWGNYDATTTVMLPPPRRDSIGGLAAIGDRANAAGIAVVPGRMILWRRDKGSTKILAETNAPQTGPIHLKLVATRGSEFRFQYSQNGKQWNNFGTPQKGAKFPPWDRSIRVGLTVGGVENASSRFLDFEIRADN